MSKKTMVNILVILIIVIGLVAFFFIFQNTKKESKNLELKFDTNAGVPYKWTIAIDNTEVVDLLEEKTEESNDGEMVGGPVKVIYILKGLKEGETTVTFRYVDIRDESIAKEEIVKVKVDKDLKVTKAE